jgi:tRNA modification GTPase
MFDNSDTIVAPATPPGSSGIGIVRLSGPAALAIAGRIFRPSGKQEIKEFPSHTLHHGFIHNGRGDIDEVLLTLMRSPHSFTREDVVEINCHGGSLPLRKTLDLCLQAGARLAEPGEFTKRAFLNGRIDLAQAEAVIEVINAKSEAALKAATAQLEGVVSQQIKTWQEQLLGVLAQVEVELDFPEEELEASDSTAVKKRLEEINCQINRLIASFEEGRLLREGIKVVLAGRPNVGKSSLLNRLLKQERAIVTAVPGTTRDTIEESFQLAGFPLRLIDTAGITHSKHEVEQEGIRRSRRSLQEADLILLLLDGSQPLQQDDIRLIQMADQDKTVVGINKQDLPQAIETEQIKAHLPQVRLVKISAKQAQGIEQLEEQIVQLLHHGGDTNQQELLLTNLRHRQALAHALTRLNQAQHAPLPELIATDIKEALDSLGEIIGLNTNEDLLERIFSNFCIGK